MRLLFSFQLFINNEFVNSVDGCTFETLNPATGKKLADVQEAKKVLLLDLTKIHKNGVFKV